MLLTPAAASPRSLIGLRMESMRAAMLLSLPLLSTTSSAPPSVRRQLHGCRRSGAAAISGTTATARRPRRELESPFSRAGEPKSLLDAFALARSTWCCTAARRGTPCARTAADESACDPPPGVSPARSLVPARPRVYMFSANAALSLPLSTLGAGAGAPAALRPSLVSSVGVRTGDRPSCPCT